MGILKKSFGWIIDAYERPVDSIDIEEIEIKLDAIEMIRPALERMVKAVDAEYHDAYSFEKNAVRSPAARKLAFQCAAIAARRFKTYTAAVTMLTIITTVLATLKNLKKFYVDINEVANLPSGITVEGLVGILDLQDVTVEKQRKELIKMFYSVAAANNEMDKPMGVGGENFEKRFHIITASVH